MKLLDILKEFVADVRAVGLDKVREEWPDLAVTYEKAERALEEVGR